MADVGEVAEARHVGLSGRGTATSMGLGQVEEIRVVARRRMGARETKVVKGLLVAARQGAAKVIWVWMAEVVRDDGDASSRTKETMARVFAYWGNEYSMDGKGCRRGIGS